LKNRSLNISAIARCVLACLPLFAAVSAHGQDRDSLVDLINDYRADPGSCEGWRADPVAPLAQHRALGRVYVEPGGSLPRALERAGYGGAHAKAIYVTGPRHSLAAMDAIERAYCRILLSTEFTAVGAARTGDTWQVVFARPAAPIPPRARLPDLRDAGQILLDAVNRARATERNCGNKHFAAAPALTLNRALGAAALAHSVDMARQNYFSHKGKDGREVEQRAVQAGYRWSGIGENIAAGQASPDEAMAGWLASPGHCANIMDRWFTEMGAAYATSAGNGKPQVYWTQVFGQPR
jgi:uncharacterized protein YkwD